MTKPGKVDQLLTIKRRDELVKQMIVNLYPFSEELKANVQRVNGSVYTVCYQSMKLRLRIMSNVIIVFDVIIWIVVIKNSLRITVNVCKLRGTVLIMIINLHGVLGIPESIC